ncbi:hypothetical protein K431DRAFT_339955 [Polychaeton citri CBS 116435]|uniref:Uncharacterized protein n=1 Tax=Polychaeton citri CBS 116435 TaxID=1314669 RepID=A0A9P4Q7L7_9PEZI|nr:hypothetical protein K431DRAFT_339955 [Polychaeton citri CBS 116435]
MVSWSTIQSTLLFLGPLLLPKILQSYRSLRLSIQRSSARTPTPLPSRTSYALTLLFLSGLVAFASTLPLFQPENIFRLTQSRLQTPNGVVFSRLAALRDLTATDEALRRALDEGGMGARLLYAKLGPRVLTECPFASAGDGDAAAAFLLYALPGVVLPHLLHIAVLGVATSPLLSAATGDSSRYRTLATAAALLLGVAEVAYLVAYDQGPNLRSKHVSEIDFVHWKLAVVRGLLIALLDGLLGWALFLHSTNRFALLPPSESAQLVQRLAEHARALELGLSRARGLGIVKNAVSRDARLRAKGEQYWVREEEAPEVLEAMRGVLRRVDVGRLGHEAEGVVAGVVGGFEQVQVQQQGDGT